MKNLKKLSIAEAEAVHNYFDHHQPKDLYDNHVDIDELEIDDEGDIVYPYAWETYLEEGADGNNGYNSQYGSRNVQYETLLTKQELESIIKCPKK